MKLTAAVAAGLLLCTGAVAGELDLSFNSDAFRIIYSQDFENNDLTWDVGYIDEDSGYIVTGSLYLNGLASSGDNPLEAGLGVRTGLVDGDDSSETGVPLAPGGYLKYTLPEFDRVSIRADAWYAPDVLAFKDLENYEDFTIRVAYNFLRNGDVFVGARYVKAEFDDDDEQYFDTGMHIGINLRF
jgi:YfaZ precursor